MAMMSEAAADDAKDRADELAYAQDAEMGRMAAVMWRQITRADAETARQVLETLATTNSPNGEFAKKISEVRTRLVQLAANGNKANDADCRELFALMQSLVWACADQWAKEDAGEQVA